MDHRVFVGLSVNYPWMVHARPMRNTRDVSVDDSKGPRSYLMGCALCRQALSIARGSETADSWTCMQTDIAILGGQSCYLSYVVPPLWVWEDPGTILGHQGTQAWTLCVQAWISIDSGWI